MDQRTETLDSSNEYAYKHPLVTGANLSGVMSYPHVQIEGGCQGGAIAPTQRVIEDCTCGFVQRVRGVLLGER